MARETENARDRDESETSRLSIIRHTARQHPRFGVTSSQLAAFGDSLIWSLEQQFCSAFTPELRQAWIALYEAVQTEMISAGGIQA
jgi:hemoglobin-like flavoprotein